MESSNQAPIATKFKIIDFSEDQFYYIRPSVAVDRTIDAELSATLDIKVFHSLGDNSISIKLVIIVFRDKDKFTLMQLSTSTVFEIQGMGQIIDQQAKNLSELFTPKDLAATLVGISYSTSRGLLYARLKGTEFSSLLLPIVDPRGMAETTIFD